MSTCHIPDPFKLYPSFPPWVTLCRSWQLKSRYWFHSRLNLQASVTIAYKLAPLDQVSESHCNINQLNGVGSSGQWPYDILTIAWWWSEFIVWQHHPWNITLYFQHAGPPRRICTLASIKTSLDPCCLSVTYSWLRRELCLIRTYFGAGNTF